MATTASQAPHDPEAPDVKDDDYDPNYDANKDGIHDKKENGARSEAAQRAKDGESMNVAGPGPVKS